MRTKIGFIGDGGLANVEADAKFAAEHGFEGLEYNYWGDFKDLTLATVAKMRKILDRYGVGCSMLGLWGWNHLSPNPAERKAAHEMLSRCIDFAIVLGAEVLTTGGGQIPDAPREKNAEEFAKVFPPFLDRIDNAGMRAAMYAVHGNSFFDSLEAYELIWPKFPQVGIKFDPANWLHHGDDYLAVARRHGDKIAHMHIKEHVYLNGEFASQPAAGMGDIQWGKLFAFLYEHGFNNTMSIEPHGDKWTRGEMRHKMLLLTQRHIGQFLI
jgi:sugar phosphate isomerase/epimerase